MQRQFLLLLGLRLEVRRLLKFSKRCKLQGVGSRTEDTKETNEAKETYVDALLLHRLDANNSENVFMSEVCSFQILSVPASACNSDARTNSCNNTRRFAGKNH